jgi:hypothetical protein
MIDCITPRMDVEDAGSLIQFIDLFMPHMNMKDPDTFDTAQNVLKVREKIRKMIDPNEEIFQKFAIQCGKDEEHG